MENGLEENSMEKEKQPRDHNYRGCFDRVKGWYGAGENVEKKVVD